MIGQMPLFWLVNVIGGLKATRQHHVLIIVIASSQFTKDEKDAVVAANLTYEPIKAFDNSVGTSGAPAFYSAGNGLESALDGFLKAAGDTKF
jgi:hypothetical protein